MATRWKWNIAGFAALRNHPTVVAAMSDAAHGAAAGTPFEVEVWPHAGIAAGPRTSVQIWARSHEAQRLVARNPGALSSTLGGVAGQVEV